MKTPPENNIRSELDKPVTVETAREITRLSELYLDGMIKFSIASDSRAMQLSNLSATGGTALLLLGTSQLLTAAPNYYVAATSLIASMTLLSAFGFALSAAMPRHFAVAGSMSRNWSSNEDLYGPLAENLMIQSKIYQDQIDSNHKTLNRNGKRLKIALYLLAATPASAAMAALLLLVLRNLR